MLVSWSESELYLEQRESIPWKWWGYSYVVE